MQVFVSTGEGWQCRQCKRAIRAGQAGLVQRTAAYVDRDIRWHVKCIQAILDTAPLDADEASFNALRDEIARTGNPFPDLTGAATT